MVIDWIDYERFHLSPSTHIASRCATSTLSILRWDKFVMKKYLKGVKLKRWHGFSFLVSLLPHHSYTSNNHLRLQLKDFTSKYEISISLATTEQVVLWQAPHSSWDVGKYLWVFIEHLRKVSIKNGCLWWWDLRIWGDIIVSYFIISLFVHASHVTRLNGLNFIQMLPAVTHNREKFYEYLGWCLSLIKY